MISRIVHNQEMNTGQIGPMGGWSADIDIGAILNMYRVSLENLGVSLLMEGQGC